MSTIDTLHELFQHMEWADACIWRSVVESQSARGDSIIRDRFFHIHMVQWAFLHVWRGKPLPEFPDQSKFTDLASIASWGHEAHRETRQYVDAVNDSMLEHNVRPPWVDDFEKYFGKPPAPLSLVQTMLQVTSHSSHHRGQVSTRLREVGGQPPYVDFIVWLLLGKPAAEWPHF